MQNLIQKFTKSSIAFEKPDILSEKFETLTNLNLKTQNLKILVEILYTFSTYQCLQKCVRDWFILLRTLVICQDQKRHGFCTLTETMFTNNSRSKQKKNLEHPFVVTGKTET